MSPTAPAPPTWFLEFWEDNCQRLPTFARGESMMNLAWSLFELLLQHVGRYARTPDGVKKVIAFGRVVTILQGAQGVLDSPDPTPEQVEQAVQRLVERVKA
jgi:hypothetical protein